MLLRRPFCPFGPFSPSAGGAGPAHGTSAGKRRAGPGGRVAAEAAALLRQLAQLTRMDSHTAL